MVPKTGSDSYLTELILALHHEVQSAVDYISDVAATQGTELGRSSALMGVERLRVKIPFRVNLEQQMKKVGEQPTHPDVTDLRHNLALRKGFMIDRGAPGKMGLFTKVRINLALPSGSGEEETVGEDAQIMGELEMTLAPLKRE